MSHEPLTDAELAELERVYAAATPGAWSLDPHYQSYIWGPNSAMMITDDGGGCPENEKDYLTRMRGVGANLPLAENGQSICALHNAFPRLLATIRDAREACAKIAEGEMVDEQATGSDQDAAYNQACRDIAAEIRRGK